MGQFSSTLHGDTQETYKERFSGVPPEMNYHGSVHGITGFFAHPLTSEDQAGLTKKCGKYFAQNGNAGNATIIFRAVLPGGREGHGRIGTSQEVDTEVLVVSEMAHTPPVILVSMEGRKTSIRIHPLDFADAKSCLPPSSLGTSRKTV